MSTVGGITLSEQDRSEPFGPVGAPQEDLQGEPEYDGTSPASDEPGPVSPELTPLPSDAEPEPSDGR